MARYRATPASTQAAHPWRATIRTLFAAAVALAGMWALVIQTLGLDPNVEWIAGTLAVAGGVTRLMAMPQVDHFIRRFLPWLAPDPDQK